MNTLKLVNDFRMPDGAARTNHFDVFRNNEHFYFQVKVTNGRNLTTGELRFCQYRFTDAQARELYNFLGTHLACQNVRSA